MVQFVKNANFVSHVKTKNWLYPENFMPPMYLTEM